MHDDIIACSTCNAWWRPGDYPWHMEGCPTKARGVDYPVLQDTEEVPPVTLDVDVT